MQQEQIAQIFKQNELQWFTSVLNESDDFWKTFASEPLYKMSEKMNAAQDGFVVKIATEMLVSAILIYLHEFEPEKDTNWETVIFLLKQTEVNEDEAWLESNLDKIFSAVAREDKYNKATEYYKAYKLYPADIQKVAAGVALSLALTIRRRG